MFGFVAAVFAELASGAPVAEQLGIAPVSIGLAFLLFSVASLIPILKVCSIVQSAALQCSRNCLNPHNATVLHLPRFVTVSCSCPQCSSPC
jgi:hypothetical protein